MEINEIEVLVSDSEEDSEIVGDILKMGGLHATLEKLGFRQVVAEYDDQEDDGTFLHRIVYQK